MRLYQQPMPPGKPRHLGSGRRDADTQDGGEREAAAAASLADQAELAIHQMHELAADREPQPAAAEAPRRRVIPLREQLEDGLLLFPWDAASGVRD